MRTMASDVVPRDITRISNDVTDKIFLSLSTRSLVILQLSRVNAKAMNFDAGSMPDLEEKRSPRNPQCVENLWRRTGFCETTLAVGKDNIQQQDLDLLSYDYTSEFLCEKRQNPSKTTSSLQALEQLMDYTYTGRLELEGLDDRTCLEIFYLAHRYGLRKLQTNLHLYLRESLSVINVCAICATAKLLHLDELLEECSRFMDLHGSAILRSESFCQLPTDVLEQTLSRDSFCANELDIFQAVKRWCKKRAMDEDVSKVLKEVRLPLIELDDLLRIVGPSKLIPAERFEQAVRCNFGDSHVKIAYRGLLIRDENVATADRRACIMSREPLRIVFRQRRDHPPIDWDRRILKHNIEEPFGINIELGEHYIINNIVLHLFDRESCAFSYYVEVSADYKDWDRVIDHSKRYRRSLQRISFKPRVVRFIRVIGTQSTRLNTLLLTSIKAFYSEQPPKLVNDEDEPFEFMSKANEHFKHQRFNFTRSDNRIYRS